MKSNKLIKFTKGALGGAFEALVNTDPGLAVAWGAIKGGVNAIRTERAEEFIVFIENNITIKQIEQPQIVDSIGLTFEQFIKQRSKEKREIIKKIFLDFNESLDWQNYELERMFQVLNTMSLRSMQFLAFLNKHVIPNSNTGLEVSRSFSSFFNKQDHKVKYADLLSISKEMFSELSGLGVVRFSGYAFISDPSNGQDNIYYSLTEFGNNFVRFIKSESDGVQ